MAYSAPTTTEFKARFPEFNSIGDPRIEAVFPEAARFVDESWSELDYKPAYMYIVAHFLVQEGVLRSSELTGIHDASGPVTSERTGNSSITYAAPVYANQSSMDADLKSTIYGRRFLTLRRRNSSPILVV